MGKESQPVVSGRTSLTSKKQGSLTHRREGMKLLLTYPPLAFAWTNIK